MFLDDSSKSAYSRGTARPRIELSRAAPARYAGVGGEDNLTRLSLATKAGLLDQRTIAYSVV